MTISKSAECQIRGHGGGCTLAVLGYEHQAAQDGSDANWLSCRVAVHGSSFGVEAIVTLTTFDIQDISSTLRQVLDTGEGTLDFEAEEGGFSLVVALARTGTADVRGTLALTDAISATLSFGFQSDQTFLRESARQLDAIRAAFPPRGEAL